MEGEELARREHHARHLRRRPRVTPEARRPIALVQVGAQVEVEAPARQCLTAHPVAARDDRDAVVDTGSRQRQMEADVVFGRGEDGIVLVLMPSETATR